MGSFVYNPSNKFLDPAKVLFQSGLAAGQIVADLGSGNGFFALAAGKLVGPSGKVYAIDILADALDFTTADARIAGLSNIQTLRCDLELPRACGSIAEGSADMVIFSNIVHEMINKANLFAEAYRLLKNGGKLLIVEWNDSPSLIGPPAQTRIKSQQTEQLAKDSNFKLDRMVETDRYHYGLVFLK